jgi:hypothetical protein
MPCTAYNYINYRDVYSIPRHNSWKMAKTQYKTEKKIVVCLCLRVGGVGGGGTAW